MIFKYIYLKIKNTTVLDKFIIRSFSNLISKKFLNNEHHISIIDLVVKIVTLPL
jgi:hypothetical protein